MTRLKKISIVFLFFICAQTISANWTRYDSKTLAWLRAIYFLDEKKGWIGGSEGILLTTGDGGETWNKAKKSTGDTIRKIHFTDENTGWLLCERDVFNLGAASPSYLLKTIDGGANWEKIEFTGGRRERVADIFFTNYEMGFAVGETGALFVLQTDGKTWKKQPAPTRYLLTGGMFSGEMTGVVIGAGGTILFTEDAGLSWDKASVAGNTAAKLHSVFFVNEKMGWAVGAQGKAFQTVNGGRYWREQNTRAAKDLNDIFFVNTAEGWAVGSDGLVLHTQTAGNVWQPVETKINHKLERVLFTGKKGFAIGFGGTILVYETGKREVKQTTPAPKMQRRNY